MKYTLSKLANGLPVLTVPMPSLESATLSVWVRTGSRSETPKILGISHFLEHMAFKGGKKYKTAFEVSEAIDAIGGEFNAGTNKDWTVYYVKARSEKIEVAFDVLSDMLIAPALRQADIDREKGVIVEEINLYEDMPARNIADVFEEVLYKGHTLQNDTIGTKETVLDLRRNDFVRYIAKHYVTENMLVVVAGGVNHSSIARLTKKYFGSLQKGPEQAIGKYVHKQSSPRLKLKTKSTDQANLILGFLGLSYDHKDRYVEAVLATVLGGGMSSRCFSEIREKRGLAYSVRTSSDHYEDAGSFATYAGVEIGKVYEAIKVILEEHFALANGTKPITDRELTKAKEYLKGHTALSLEDTQSVSFYFALKKFFNKKITTPDQVFSEVDKVTREQVVALARRLFVPETLNLALIGPYKDASKFEKIIKK